MKASLVIFENQVFVREGISKGQYDFSLGLNSTSQTFFKSTNGERGNPCFSGKFRLAHEKSLPSFLDRIVFQGTLQFHGPMKAVLQLFRLGSGDPFINDVLAKPEDSTDTNARDFIFLR